jgi:hypothetical protein
MVGATKKRARTREEAPVTTKAKAVKGILDTKEEGRMTSIPLRT